MIVSNKQFAIEKLICCAIVLFFIVLLSPYHVMHAFVVLGHAHFALTYLYQYKAGKIKPIYVLPFIISAAFFLFLTYAYPALFVLFVATFFLFHNFFDEFKLNGLKPSVEYFAVIMIAMAFLTGWSIDFYYDMGATRPVIYGGLVVALLLFIIKAVVSSIHLPIKSAYFWFLFLIIILFATLEFSGNRLDARETIGGTILLHYFSCYMRLGFRFREAGGEVFNPYLIRVFMVNAIFIAGYIIIVIVLDKNNVLYPMIYRPQAFYAWTLLHLITTFRFAEYKSALNFSKIS